MALRHIVCFKFKPSVSMDIKEQFVKEGQLLKTLIQDLDFSIEIATSLTDDRSKGYTHFLYSEFHSKDDLAMYAVHPHHQQFVSKYKPHLEDVMAFDLPM